MKLPRITTPSAFKRDFYLATRNLSNDLDEYGDPVGDEFYEPIPFLGNDGINYQPLQSESDIAMYGGRSQDIVKAVIMQTDNAYEFFMQDDMEGSLVYLFGSSPFKKPNWEVRDYDKEPVNGAWANYEVDAVMPMIQHVNVFFKRKKRTGAK